MDPPVQVDSPPVVAPAPAPPPVVVPIKPAPSLVDTIVSPPARPQLAGSGFGLTAGPLFGLVGLVLIPAAGAALGYRQAKAAELSDRS